MAKVTDYKGYEIHVGGDGTFQALKDGDVAAESQTLDALKKTLDGLSKTRMGIAVFVRDYETYVEGKVTSVQEQAVRYGGGGTRKKYRVTHKRGRDTGWRDHNAFDLVKKTPENEKRVSEYNGLMDERSRLKKDAEEIEGAMERYKDSDLLG